MSISNQLILTFDIDWAPDWVIDSVAQRLIESQVRATWFVTHSSEAIERLAACNLFELGIHPNVSTNSTHGKSEDEVLQHMLSLLPEATCMRTHGLYQSSSFLIKAVRDYGISIDVSLFLPRASHLEMHQVNWFGLKLLRVPYFWEDDSEMFESEPIWSLENKYVKTAGLKVFDFHPIHIVLNTQKFEQYQKLKNICPVSEWTEKFVAEHRLSGRGPATLFEELVESLRGGGTQISELAFARA